ncbi:MAG TPA: flagellar biosynthetic protein FliO [Spirochaetota bacterium]|nr:flagellar biosynthetic protein FliO [Spirochaetota bacterium]HPI88577.1 flagellar biosynthetic protein FliO [Spirochaetota bacterium]HPR48218.1 flagellar biosynthetic protein FliO [Spirochaetota bacterium]
MRHNIKKIFFKPIVISFILTMIFSMTGVFIVPATHTVLFAESKKKAAVKVENNVKETAPSSQETSETENTGITEKEFTENDFRPQIEEESYVWLVFKTLIVIALLGGGFYYIFRFLSKKAGIQLMGGEVAQVLSVVPIGQNKYIQIVDLAGRVLVLGVSDSSINLITEITAKDEIDRIRIKSQQKGTVQPERFQEYLVRGIGKIINIVNEKREKARGGQINRPIDDYIPGADLDYLQKQRTRLKRMNGLDNE